MNTQNNQLDNNSVDEEINTSAAQTKSQSIPPLGSFKSKAVNMKALVFMGMVGLLILGFAYVFYAKRAATKAANPKKEAPEQIVIPERKRAAPALPAIPDNPPPIGLAGGGVPAPIIYPPGGPNPASSANAPMPISLASKRSTMGGSILNNEMPLEVGAVKSGSLEVGMSAEQRAAMDADNIIRRRAQEGGSVVDFLGGILRKPATGNTNIPGGNQQNVNPATGAGASNAPNRPTIGATGAAGAGNGSAGAGAGGGTAAGAGAGGLSGLLGGLSGNLAGGASQLAAAVTGGQGGAGAGSSGSDDPAATEFFIKSARAIPHSRDSYIVQGTNIRCVMETRIISDVEGTTMCAVVENIYSVNATKVLVPKGSRMIGEYKKGSDSPERAGIIWSRLITPSGLDVAIKSPATDLLGAPAVPGYVDDHWGEKLTAAFLISVASDIFKYTAITRGPKVAKTIVDAKTGTVTIVEEPFESALVNNASKIPEQLLAKSLTRPRTITIPQGTLINIITQRDLDFSSVY